MAKGSMTTNSTVDVIDKTLSIDGAPADAAAVRKLIEESLAAQRAEDYAKIKFWVSPDPTSPAELFGGTWERIEDKFIMGASDTHPAGTTVKAGLPSIYGQANGVLFSSDQPAASGLFSVSLANGWTLTKGSSSGDVSIYANNVRTASNPIYGASNTVQPPAYCMYIWRRIA